MHFHRLSRQLGLKTWLTPLPFPDKFRLIPFQSTLPFILSVLFATKCLHYQKRLRVSQLLFPVSFLGHDTYPNLVMRPIHIVCSEYFGKYFARDCKFDNFLVEVGGGCVISLVLIVECNRIVLAHGCLLLIAFWIWPDFSFGEGGSEIRVELKSGFLFLWQSGCR